MRITSSGLRILIGVSLSALPEASSAEPDEPGELSEPGEPGELSEPAELDEPDEIS
ncbi:MAG: hypothetical protein GXY17_11910, partial [Clostridiaceae bacterium]|nr:hypothetical protein [Clostridiaceae bacterium]